MPTFGQIKDTIYDVIDSIGLVPSDQISYQYQNSPNPDKPSFTLLLNSFMKIARDVFANQDVSGNTDMIGNREFTLMIMGYGFGIVELTHRLQTQFETPAIHKAFVDGGIVPFNIDNPIQDISGLDESENEERSSYDVLFRTDSIISEVPLGLIEKVNAEGAYKQEGKPDIITTLNIDSTI